MAWNDGMEKRTLATKVASERAAKVASRIYDENLLDPKSFGGQDSRGRVVASGNRLFNAQGELNAQSKEDAISQLQHFAALREQKRIAKNTSYYSPEEKERIIESALSTTPENRVRFGADMIPLILDRLDYEGFIRQIYRVHNIPQGAVNRYEKDINVTALVTNEDGQTIGTQVRGNAVYPAEFMITAMPKVTISEIAQRQFDIVERTHDKTTFQVMLKEDRQGLREMYAASQVENNTINVTSTVSKPVLEALQYEVERWRLQVDKFLMNRQELGDLKKNVNAIDFDPITSRDLLLTGIFGSIWGVNVYITAGVDELGIESVSVPAGMIFAVTDGRYLGAMPVRVELNVFPADQFVYGSASYGWFFCEQISQVVLNPRAVAVATKSNAVIPTWLTD